MVTWYPMKLSQAFYNSTLQWEYGPSGFPFLYQQVLTQILDQSIISTIVLIVRLKSFLSGLCMLISQCSGRLFNIRLLAQSVRLVTVFAVANDSVVDLTTSVSKYEFPPIVQIADPGSRIFWYVTDHQAYFQRLIYISCLALHFETRSGCKRYWIGFAERLSDIVPQVGSYITH